MRQYYNKLVRDKIPEIIHQSGNQCEVATMSEVEFSQALRDKLIEEAQEVITASPDNLVSELADLQEVIDSLLVLYEIEHQVVAKAQERKRAERGGFQQRLNLLWSESS